MYKKHDYKNLWMSPNIAITRLSSLIDKYGIEKILKKSVFKHEREAWVAASFLLGLREVDKREYWIEIETQESTPDIYGYYLDVIKGNFHRRVFNIEIVEWEEHGGDILDIIRNKCKKNYPHDFFLLIYVRRGGEIIRYDDICESIKTISVPFVQIWILAPSSENNDYHLTLIFKNKFQIRFNLNEAIEKNKQQRQFATSLGRGVGTDIKDLGIVYVPFPQIDD